MVFGHRGLESTESAALRMLNAFCGHHPLEVVLTPLGLFPAVDPHDPAWLERLEHMTELLAVMTPLDTV